MKMNPSRYLHTVPVSKLLCQCWYCTTEQWLQQGKRNSWSKNIAVPTNCRYWFSQLETLGKTSNNTRFNKQRKQITSITSEIYQFLYAQTILSLVHNTMSLSGLEA